MQVLRIARGGANDRSCANKESGFGRRQVSCIYMNAVEARGQGDIDAIVENQDRKSVV